MKIKGSCGTCGNKIINPNNSLRCLVVCGFLGIEKMKTALSSGNCLDYKNGLNNRNNKVID